MMTRARVVSIVVTAVAAVLVLAASGCRRQQSEPAPCTTAAAAGVVAPPAWRTMAGRTVILDPGHGGKDEGTCHFGLKEKDINLDLALRTASLLRARGARVVLTRESDVFVPLAERSAVANQHVNATFVSIHVNASGANPNAAGVETFILRPALSDEERAGKLAEKFRTTDPDPVRGQQALASLAARSRQEGRTLAASLQRSLVQRLGETDRGVKGGNLAVLRETYFAAAALVEVGFLSHARTAERMQTEEWRRRTAAALSDGIADYLLRPE